MYFRFDQFSARFYLKIVLFLFHSEFKVRAFVVLLMIKKRVLVGF